MWIILVPAGALTLATLVIATLAWAGVWFFHGRAESFWKLAFWKPALVTHLVLLVVHTTLTIPLLLGGTLPRFQVQTRGDEAAYRGPRFAADGSWQIQSRETLLEDAQADAKESRATAAARVSDPEESAFAVHFKAADGVPLRGFLVPSRKPTPRFVAVLAHGLFRGACELETVGSMLRDAGGEVLLLELRNHGDSGRARATFGRDESQDVVAAVDFLRRRPEARERPLILFGVSLGTAAVMIAAPKLGRIAGVILDAPIDDLYTTGDRMIAGIAKRRSLGPEIPQLLRAVMLFGAEHFGGVDFAGTDTVGSLCRLSPKIPILLIAAGEDDRVPNAGTQRLLEKLATEPDKKQLWLVAAATHGKVWEVEPQEYRKQIGKLLDQAVGPEQ